MYQTYITERLNQLPPRAIDRKTPTLDEWQQRAPVLRESLRRVLGFPENFVFDEPVSWEIRGSIQGDGYRIERIVYESETWPHSLVPALLYIPEWLSEKGLSADNLPAIILASGHGGSKSTLYNQYAGQLYAHLGCVVLLPDPIGQEERHHSGVLNLRGHREDAYLDRAAELGRPIVGKMVFDLVRGIDLLRAHPQVDPNRIACAGSSLGGTVTQYLAAVDERLSACVSSAWMADYRTLNGEEGCCFRIWDLMQHVNQAEMIGLGAPHCANLVMVGEQDEVCPPTGAKEMARAAQKVYELFGAADLCQLVYNEKYGHQPYHISPVGLDWLAARLQTTPSWGETPPPVVTLGEMSRRHDTEISKLYNVERHHRGSRLYDIGLVKRSEDQLRVLTEQERKEGPFAIHHWIEQLERAVPRPPGPDADEEEFQLWQSQSQAKREALIRLLRLDQFTLQWCAGKSVAMEELKELGLDAPGLEEAVGEGIQTTVHSLRLRPIAPIDENSSMSEMWGALTIRSPDSDKGTVIYLPEARDWRQADWDKVSRWLQKGRRVIVLSSVKLFDNELLVGINGTAFNVALVKAAIDQMAVVGGRITCHGEVDDVAAWAALSDSRIKRVEVFSRGRVEPSMMGIKRREGVVWESATVTDRMGLWALLLPAEVEFGPGVLTPQERAQFEAIKQRPSSQSA